jgi:general stress protein 26
MTTPKDLEDKFWLMLKADRTVMLGLTGDNPDHAQPMTALFEGERGGPIWFFTSNETDLSAQIGDGVRAMMQFVAKTHDVFACVDGRLQPDNDRRVIDRLWNPFVAAWYEGGKEDPKLLLLRFDLDSAKIWLNENSLFAGIKMLLGVDPKEENKDKVAVVDVS